MGITETRAAAFTLPVHSAVQVVAELGIVAFIDQSGLSFRRINAAVQTALIVVTLLGLVAVGIGQAADEHVIERVFGVFLLPLGVPGAPFNTHLVLAVVFVPGNTVFAKKTRGGRARIKSSLTPFSQKIESDPIFPFPRTMMCWG